jgi:hypothetical protein
MSIERLYYSTNGRSNQSLVEYYEKFREEAVKADLLAGVTLQSPEDFKKNMNSTQGITAVEKVVFEARQKLISLPLGS